jgi:hypothetical protein
MHAPLPRASVPKAIHLDIAVLNQAVLEGDLDCARQCVDRLRERLDRERLDAGLSSLRGALDRLATILGPAGTSSAPGALDALAQIVEAFEHVIRRPPATQQGGVP